MQPYCNQYPRRTLETLTKQLNAFQEDGTNLKNAKHFVNVIHARLFNIAICQVGKSI